MMKAQDQVRDFCHMIKAPISPAEPQLRDVTLRARLIAEEAMETIVALVGSSDARDILQEYSRKTGSEKPSIVGAIDGLCDLVYVALGTAEAIGVDLEPYFNEVHASNMTKVNAPVDEFGKRGGKREGYQPPRIADILYGRAL